MKKALLFGSLLLNLVSSHADSTIVSTSTLNEVREKIVELHITFAPPPNAEVKKQRKAMMYNKTGQALCSGAFVSDLGHILTAKHCAEGTTEITAITFDGQEYKAAVRALASAQDLALLQIGHFNNAYFKLGNVPTQNQNVWIMGSPLGLTGLITAGIVAKLYGDYTLLDCTAAPGNSGGPVFNSKGELVGILTAMIVVYMGPSHITVAQSVDSVRMFAYEMSGRK